MNNWYRTIVLVGAVFSTIAGPVTAQATGHGSVLTSDRSLPPDSTSQQRPSPYRPGTAVRVHTVDGAVLQGLFAGSGRDSVFLRLDAEQVTAIPGALVRRMEYKFTEDQRRTWRLRGLITGAGLGLLTGVTLGAAHQVPECKSIAGCPLDTRTGYMVAFGILGAGLGSVAGHLIAHSLSGEWQTHSLPRLALSPRIRGDSPVGMTVSVRVPFTHPPKARETHGRLRNHRPNAGTVLLFVRGPEIRDFSPPGKQVTTDSPYPLDHGEIAGQRRLHPSGGVQ